MGRPRYTLPDAFRTIPRFCSGTSCRKFAESVFTPAYRSPTFFSRASPSSAPTCTGDSRTAARRRARITAPRGDVAGGSSQRRLERGGKCVERKRSERSEVASVAERKPPAPLRASRWRGTPGVKRRGGTRNPAVGGCDEILIARDTWSSPLFPRDVDLALLSALRGADDPLALHLLDDPGRAVEPDLESTLEERDGGAARADDLLDRGVELFVPRGVGLLGGRRSGDGGVVRGRTLRAEVFRHPLDLPLADVRAV